MQVKTHLLIFNDRRVQPLAIEGTCTAWRKTHFLPCPSRINALEVKLGTCSLEEHPDSLGQKCIHVMKSIFHIYLASLIKIGCTCPITIFVHQISFIHFKLCSPSFTIYCGCLARMKGLCTEFRIEMKSCIQLGYNAVY